MTEIAQRGRLTVYAAGGCGINIASELETQVGKQNVGFSDIDVYYLDTSLSNLKSSIPQDRVYKVEGVDGSGKVRQTNHKKIAKCIQEILLSFEPGDLSIVISSASGGSGSVIAPTLVSELLERGHNVITMTVGSSDSRIELDNTIKTLMSYEAISKLRGRPVAMAYHENTSSKPRAHADSEIRRLVNGLSALYSRQNTALDSEDLRNWLDFHRSTSFEPSLVLLDTIVQPVEAQKAVIISVATLANPDHNTSMGSNVEYQAVGYIKPEAGEAIRMTSATHFVLLDNAIGTIHQDLANKLRKIDEETRARKSHIAHIDTSGHNPTEGGLIL